MIAVNYCPDNENISELLEIVSRLKEDEKQEHTKSVPKSIRKADIETETKEKATTNMISPRNFHIKRKSNSERAFVPLKSDPEPNKKRLKRDDKSMPSSISNYQLTKL